VVELGVNFAATGVAAIADLLASSIRGHVIGTLHNGKLIWVVSGKGCEVCGERSAAPIVYILSY
jgi:hypothetical protein